MQRGVVAAARDLVAAVCLAVALGAHDGVGDKGRGIGADEADFEGGGAVVEDDGGRHGAELFELAAARA